MKHHPDCSCERCDTTGASAVKPYPVSKYPVYANPNHIPISQSPSSEKGSSSTPGTISTIQEAFMSAAPRQAFAVLLEKKPELVHEVGFNGQQPLHKACLRGDPGLVELMLHHGADVNARTDFNETPLHFACKRGHPRIMHLLIEAGADLNAVDKSGKCVMHHAAQGGSVLALHYLNQVCGEDFNQRDYYFILPIHLAAAHGHREVFMYLTRNGRCDLFERDGHENNVLHLAAQAGHEELCWTILEQGKLSLIHEQNKQGMTPLQFAQMGPNAKHREIVKWMSLYAKDTPHDKPVSGPVLGWWFHLILPALIYAMCLSFAQFFEQKGWTMLLGLAFTVFVLYGHGHRMQHVCRWPNPIHAGCFAAGFFYTMFCSYIVILPSMYMDYPVFSVITLGQTLLMSYMYYTLLTRDPGVIKESELKTGMNEPYSVRDIATGLIRIESLCQDCEIIPPPRSHHCKICVKCYYDLDHHCLFLYQCIARNNHRKFVLFIADVMLSMIMFEYVSFQFLHNIYSSLSLYEAAWQIFYEQPWVWTLMLMNGVSMLWGVNLLRFQLGIVSVGHTTAYQPFRRGSLLSRRQRFSNIIAFLKGRQPRHLEEVIDGNHII